MPASVGSPRPTSVIGSPTSAGQPSPSQVSPRSATAAMQSMNISVQPPGPSGPGKVGENLKVLTNHFLCNLVDFPESIFKWTADIKSAGSRSQTVVGRVKRRVFELLLMHDDEFSHGVYTDFTANLWSFKPLTPRPGVSRSVVIDYYEPEESGPRTGPNQVLYQVQIINASDPLPTAPLKALLSDPGSGTVIQRPVIDYEDALNHMILRYAALHPDLETAARGTKIFPKANFPQTPGPPKRHPLGGGLTVSRGYNRRARITQGGVHLVLTTTASAMYEPGRASQLINNWRKAHRGELPEGLNQFLRGVRVMGKFGNDRVKPIHKLHPADTHTATFHCDIHPRTQTPVNRNVTVAWFFEQAYNIRLAANGMVLDVGSRDRSCLWPAELCEVLPAQSYKGILPLPEQAQAMIKHACRSANDNAKLITTEGQDMVGIDRANGSPGTISGTPIKILLHMATVSARQIPSPSLVFANGTLSGRDTKRGQWNLQGRRFIRSPTGRTSFTVIVLKRASEPGISNFQTFVDSLSTGVRQYCGLSNVKATQVPDVPAAVDWPAQDQVSWLKRLFTHCSKHVSYIFVVASSPQWYPAIKEAGDTTGVQTTVTLRMADNTARPSPGVTANLMLKYNMKTGGSNWNLAPAELSNSLRKNTMFLGLDVVHPSPASMKRCPSGAGLVYSVSPDPDQFLPWVVLLQPQEGKAAREVVPTPSLKPGIVYALRMWLKRNNGNLPQAIFMCRDGVSDAQLQQVLDEELTAIKLATKAIYGDKKMPEICLINTQKRHMTRFFRAKDNKAADKVGAFDQKGNPLPGLIIDQGIVSRMRDDWYAVSHKCLQGTSRPAHHIRLWDEIHLSKDQLQQLVHNLSFIYPRSVTSVSIPTPAKLADRLCERIKTRLHNVYFPSEENRGRTWSVNNARFLGQESFHPDIRDTMHYI